MSRFAKAIRKFFSEEDAPSAVEYGLMIALIASILMVGPGKIGKETSKTFRKVAQEVKKAIPK